MKTLFKHYPLLAKKTIMAVTFITIAFSCSKETGDPINITKKYCGNIDWNNSLGTSGYFAGTISDGQFNLVAVNTVDDGVENFHAFHRTNENNVILNDQPGWTFTYEAGKIVKLVFGDATSIVTFTYDSNSHLTNTHIQSTDDQGSTELIFTYTYDINDDPVKITGKAVSVDTDGKKSSANYDITADYLTDKINILPLVPEITPFSIYFGYTFFLSRHLINKWVIKINGIATDGKAFQVNFTQQYSYTYDANGNVKTMVHTGNSNNTYNFTYSGCI